MCASMSQVNVGDHRRYDGVIETMEMLTGGEPTRIVTSGYADIPGQTVAANGAMPATIWIICAPD